MNLAEVKSVEEKRRLSTAYSEVLGIKKYEDIRRTLENLRLKLRKNAGASVSVAKLEKLSAEVVSIEQNIDKYIDERATIDERIAALKIENDSLQERLIREGNAMSVEDLEKQKALLKSLQETNASMKQKFRDMLDLAPFAISGKLLYELYHQLRAEQDAKAKTANADAIIYALRSTHQELTSNIKNAGLTESQIELLASIINDSFAHHTASDANICVFQCFKVCFDLIAVVCYVIFYDLEGVFAFFLHLCQFFASDSVLFAQLLLCQFQNFFVFFCHGSVPPLYYLCFYRKITF